MCFLVLLIKNLIYLKQELEDNFIRILKEILQGRHTVNLSAAWRGDWSGRQKRVIPRGMAIRHKVDRQPHAWKGGFGKRVGMPKC